MVDSPLQCSKTRKQIYALKTLKEIKSTKIYYYLQNSLFRFLPRAVS